MKSILVATLCTSVVSITMGLTWPLLALILHGRGVSESWIGISSASQSLVIVFVAPLVPRLIATHGFVRTVKYCIISTIVCLILLPLYVDVFVWFPIRLILGASVSILFIAGETWVNHMAGDASRGRIIGLFGFLWSAGFAVGPVIISVTGIEGWTPFLVGIALVALAGASLPLARDVTPVLERAKAFPPRRLIALAPAAILIAPILGAIEAINDSLYALYLIGNGFDRDQAVLVLTVILLGTMTGHMPFGWLADHLDRRRLLVGATLAAAGLSVLVPCVVGQGWIFWPVIFLWGSALGGLWTIAIVMIGQSYAGVQLVAANSLYTALRSAGAVTGPILGGLLMDGWSLLAVPVLLSVLLFLYVPLAALRGKPPGEKSLE